MKIKAKDIAMELGVSTATVSLALNDKPGVNEKTKRMILDYRKEKEEAAKRRIEAGAERDRGRDMAGNGEGAETEKGRESGVGGRRKEGRGTIAIVVYKKNKEIIEDTNQYMFLEVVTEIDTHAHTEGFQTRLISFDERKEELSGLLALCREEKYVGIFLMATEMYEEDLEHFRGLNIPIIVYDNDYQEGLCDSICVNNRQAVKLGMKYLNELGHKQIQYLHHGTWIYNFEERRQGYIESLRKYHLPMREDSMLYMGQTAEEAYHRMKRHLEDGGELPTAYFTENYMISIGVLKALREKGIRVPEDISVLGVDELPHAALVDLTLTHIRIPHGRRGTLAIERLMERIIHGSDANIQILVGARLVIGSSTKKIWDCPVTGK